MKEADARAEWLNTQCLHRTFTLTGRFEKYCDKYHSISITDNVTLSKSK